MNGDETLKQFKAGKKTKLHFYEGKIWLFFLSLASRRLKLLKKWSPRFRKMRPDLSAVFETIGNTCFMFQQLADGRMVQAHEEPITFEAENDGPHQVHNSQDLRSEIPFHLAN